MMKGIQFITDSQGNKVAALVDLKEYGQFWQDIIAEMGELIDFQFLINECGEKIAVLLDFSKHEELWEDIYDSLTLEEIKKEPKIPWQEVKEQLNLKNELNV